MQHPEKRWEAFSEQMAGFGQVGSAPLPQPIVPCVVNEIDKKTKKRRVYVTNLIGEEDLDDATFCIINEMYDEIKTDGHPDGVSLRLA